MFLEKLFIINQLVSQSLISLYYVDESGFNMMPNVPYGYQPKGVQWTYPSIKKTVMNVLGFLNPQTNHLVTYPLPKNTYMNSELFIKYVNDFVLKIAQPTVLVLDNASWHKSAETRAMFPIWEEQNLHILFLPPRCPHLNKIETLWRKIKYEWLAINNYRSEATLNAKLKDIFQTYGLKYTINFSKNSKKQK